MFEYIIAELKELVLSITKFQIFQNQVWKVVIITSCIGILEYYGIGAGAWLRQWCSL